MQDLQVDTALCMGIVPDGGFGQLLFRVEAFLLRRATVVSTNTEAMRQRIVAKGIEPRRTMAFPNWADTELVRPMPHDNTFRRELGVPGDEVLIGYAGVMGEKQGLELVIAAADRLRDVAGTHFVLIGAGARRARLEWDAHRGGLTNMRFLPPQPASRLPEMLAAADNHLVVQRREATDLVMPSNLTNVLAAGRPAIATADPGTALHDVLAGHDAGLVTPPGDLDALVGAIERLRAGASLRTRMGQRARAYAETHLANERILTRFEEDALRVVRGTYPGPAAAEAAGSAVR